MANYPGYLGYSLHNGLVAKEKDRKEMRKKEKKPINNILFFAKNPYSSVIQNIYLFDIMQFMLMKSRATRAEA